MTTAKNPPVYNIATIFGVIISIITIGSLLWSIATSQTRIQMTVDQTAKIMAERVPVFEEIFKNQTVMRDDIESISIDVKRLEGSQITFVHAEGTSMIVKSPSGQTYTIPIKSDILTTIHSSK